MTQRDQIRQEVARILDAEGLLDAPTLYRRLAHMQGDRPIRSYKRDVRWAREQWIEGQSDSVDTGAEVRDRYTYDAEEYHFELAGEEPFSVELDTVQQWVRWYVHDGGGLTQRTVTRMSWQELGQPLTKDYARRIFAVLGITKDSPPFAPHMLSSMTPDQLAKLHFAKAQADVETAIRADEPREWRKAWRSAERRAAELEAKLSDHQRRAAEMAESIHRHARAVPVMESVAWSRYLLVVGVYDVHVGKRTVEGHGLEETASRLSSCARQLIDAALRYGRPERVQIVFGGDFVHVDSERGTTRGTPQDMAAGWTEIIRAAWDLAEDYVDLWRQVGAPIVVRWIPGNHDEGATYYLAQGFRRIYRDTDVTVEHDADPLQVDRYGTSLIAYEHGDGAKASDYATILAHQHPYLWGQTRQRYVVTGHLHHVHEYDTGVTVLQQPSIAGADQWHRKRGYVTSRHGMRAYAIDPTRGHIATFSAWTS